MKKTILEIYALAVCFATIVCFAIVLIIGTYDLIRITNPEFTLGSCEHNQHQSNDAFWESKHRYDPEGKEKKRPPEETLTKQRLESYRKVIESEKREAFQSLTLILIILIVDIVIFWVHWRIARRARAANHAPS